MKSFRLYLLCITICLSCTSPQLDKTKYEGIKDQKYTEKRWTRLNEKGKIGEFFKRDGRIYCGEVMFNDYPMKDIDIASFIVMPNSGYAKDNKHVYYPLGKICVDGKGWGCCYCDQYISDANVASFEHLGGEYGRDRENVFFMGKIFNKVSTDSFSVINGGNIFFGKDGRHIYDGDKVLAEADVSSFHYDSISNTFADKAHKWQYMNGFLMEMNSGDRTILHPSVLKLE